MVLSLYGYVSSFPSVCDWKDIRCVQRESRGEDEAGWEVFRNDFNDFAEFGNKC